jgi:hypothetical protein
MLNPPGAIDRLGHFRKLLPGVAFHNSHSDVIRYSHFKLPNP